MGADKEKNLVAGLDLSASAKRCSGYAEIDVASRSLTTALCLYTDDEILSTASSRASIVAVDAPIAGEARMRELDREAIRRGYRVLPPSLGGMRALTARAWRIYQELSRRGVVVIETHPRSAMKSSGFRGVREILKAYGISPNAVQGPRPLSKDIEDAIVAAVVAYCYYIGSCIEEVRAPDGVLYLLRPPGGARGPAER